MRAGNHNLSLALWHAQALTALRALEIAVCLTVSETALCTANPVRYRTPPSHKLFILRIPRLNIAREHAEIAQAQQCENKYVHPRPAENARHDNECNAENEQRVIERRMAEIFSICDRVSVYLP